MNHFSKFFVDIYFCENNEIIEHQVCIIREQKIVFHYTLCSVNILKYKTQ